MAINTDSTFNGTRVRGTATSGTASLAVSFITEVDNPDGVEVGYFNPTVVATAINAYATQQGWGDVVFACQTPENVATVGNRELSDELGL